MTEQASARRAVAAVSERGVSYSIHGSGGPVIVLLHGWCLNRRIWMYQAERLAVRHTVIAVDLRGFGVGCSAALGGPYDLATLASDVEALIGELGAGAPIVAGFAFGAAVAITLAIDAPEAVGGLVLIGVPDGATAPYERMPVAMRRDWHDFARRSAEAICSQPQSEATLRWLGDMFAATELPVAIEAVEVLAQFYPRSVVPSVRVPSLLVHGADDPVVPTSIAKESARLMADAQLEVVAQCGHLVLIDQPERTATLIEEFVSRVVNRAA